MEQFEAVLAELRGICAELAIANEYLGLLAGVFYEFEEEEGCDDEGCDDEEVAAV